MTADKPKGCRGRPVDYPMPERIPDTPENAAKAVLNAPPPQRNESYNAGMPKRRRPRKQ